MAEQHGTARPRKRAKKQNALKHGVYSRELMLPGEKMRDPTSYLNVEGRERGFFRVRRPTQHQMMRITPHRQCKAEF
jgi:hypothetical protein